jgi:preprotein translocase subunit SecF
MNLIKHRKVWYIISLLVTIPGLISLALWGLKPSIDFTGGTLMEFSGTQDKFKIEEIAKSEGLENVTTTVSSSENIVILKSKALDDAKQRAFKQKIESEVSGAKQQKIDTVGPSISKEITYRAFTSVALAAFVIVFYIGYSFRKVPKPANSFEFGFAAIVALMHDTIVVLGVFSIMGHFLGTEVDPLFITALLTVIGFSVHDTIVIFDRIRENLIRGSYKDFEETVSVSVTEMLPRTINTTFLVWVILLILLVFGGVTIRNFVLALVVGIFSGTYSSILNASPLLVTWQKFKTNRKKK